MPHGANCENASNPACYCDCGGKGHGAKPIPGVVENPTSTKVAELESKKSKRDEEAFSMYGKMFSELSPEEKKFIERSLTKEARTKRDPWFQDGYAEGSEAADVNVEDDPEGMHEALEEDRLGEIAGEVREHQVQMAGDLSYDVGRKGGPTEAQYERYEEGFYRGFEEQATERLSASAAGVEPIRRAPGGRRAREGEANPAHAHRGEADTAGARELKLYIDNDGQLHRQQHEPIIKNLTKKMEKGTYDREKAVTAFENLADTGAQKYGKEFGEGGKAGLRMFDPATRHEAAVQLRDSFEAEARAGRAEEGRLAYMMKYRKEFEAAGRGNGNPGGRRGSYRKGGNPGGEAKATHKGIYYFPTFEAARAYAREHEHPTDRIIRYERGWAIQERVSGPYVGPSEGGNPGGYRGSFERGTRARAVRDVLARRIPPNAAEPYAVATSAVQERGVAAVERTLPASEVEAEHREQRAAK